jgi:hypothetical protein|tara:strand:+ start:113 stop:637 length:525 start_codon:yes stop_codon:yes gene_type:complete
MRLKEKFIGVFRKKKSRRIPRATAKIDASIRIRQSSKGKSLKGKSLAPGKKHSLSSKQQISMVKGKSKRRTRRSIKKPSLIEIYTYRNIMNIMNDTTNYKDINISDYHDMGEKAQAIMNNLKEEAKELYNYIEELKTNDRIRSNDENLPGFKLQYIILKESFDKAKQDAKEYII